MDGFPPERRKHQRFVLTDQCFIRREANLGSLIDLSLGGLSCSCCASGLADCPVRSRQNVDLYCIENKIWIWGLRIDIIASEKIPGQFLDNFWVRKCRARFDNLQEEQASLLKYLIQTHAGQ